MRSKKAIIIIGVSGSGKTTIGRRLSQELKISYFEGDDFHPPENIDKMSKGVPLNDQDRWPWLMSIAQGVNKQPKDQNLVISCSALKSLYRSFLEENIERDIIWIALTGNMDTIKSRMKNRNHFMPSDLLDSQFSIWEPPANALQFNVQMSVENIVEEIISKL